MTAWRAAPFYRSFGFPATIGLEMATDVTERPMRGANKIVSEPEEGCVGIAGAMLDGGGNAATSAGAGTWTPIGLDAAGGGT